MIEAWLVVREERHIDDRHWVCIDKSDALKIARDVTAYWWEKMGFIETPETNQSLDTICYENQVFHCDVENQFRVYVVPIEVREEGEADFALS